MPLTKPDIQTVADLLQMRTVTRGGSYEGDFTANTTPSDTQAQRVIDKSHDVVFGKLGDPADWNVPADDIADYEGEATELIAMWAAMQIELSWYGDQVKSGQSPYPEYKTQFNESMNQLLEDLGLPGEVITGGRGGQIIERPVKADYGYPETSIGDGIMP